MSLGFHIKYEHLTLAQAVKKLRKASEITLVVFAQLTLM